MATSFAIIILFGFLVNKLFKKMKLPGLLGMLLLGVVLGQYGLDLLDKDLVRISPDLRKIALIIILLRAGLGVSKDKLKSVGTTAIKMSCIPGLLEGFTVAFLSMKLLGFTFIEGGILGFIIAAVSPAVVVPHMINFIDKGVGKKNNIPVLILAGASIDDVFAITIFSTFLGMYGGSHVNIGAKLLGIPLSILLGIGLGVVVGIILVKLFKVFSIRDTEKVLVILSISILFTSLENALKDKIEIAALLGIMAVGFMLLEKSTERALRLASKFNKVWVLAEIMLFVLVGAEVNVSVAFDSGLKGLAIIAIGLIARSLGVFISTWGSKLSMKERIFCMIAYSPKATVQAAIGATPLAAGVVSGDIMLAIAVLSILVTAPLGSIGIKSSAPILLDN